LVRILNRGIPVHDENSRDVATEIDNTAIKAGQRTMLEIFSGPVSTNGCGTNNCHIYGHELTGSSTGFSFKRSSSIKQIFLDSGFFR